MEVLTVRNVRIGEGKPKIIVPLVGKTNEELLTEAGQLLSESLELVEWRVDFYEQVENAAAVVEVAKELREILADIPLIFTFRTKKEGGEKEISEEEYLNLNLAAIRSGAVDIVDVELFSSKETVETILREAENHGVFIIMSNHEFTFTPPKEEIINRLAKMQEYGAHLLKIAVMPKSTADVLTLLEATNTFKEKNGQRPIVTMAMGGLGLISRMTGEVFGSALTFAAGKKASAPGQIPVAELKMVLDILHKNIQ